MLSALVLCSVVGAAPTPAPGAPTFTDPNGRFSFHVPQEWQSRQAGVAGTIAAWQSTDPAGTFQISTVALAAGTTLDGFVAQSVPGIKGYFPDANVDASKAQSLTLGGQPARRLDYAGTSQGTRVQLAQTFTVQNGVGYGLTAVALPGNFARFMDRARVALDSFAFLQPTVAPASTGGRDKGLLIAFIALLIAMLALIGVLLRNRNRRPRRTSREIAATRPLTDLGAPASAPPGIPAPPADYTNTPAAYAVGANGAPTAELPIAAEGDVAPINSGRRDTLQPRGR